MLDACASELLGDGVGHRKELADVACGLDEIECHDHLGSFVENRLGA